jgi:RNA polymerase sigma-70 factor, ECF subfamily
MHAPASAEIEASVMRSFQEAWAAVDIQRIVALLTDDAILTMPPIDVRVEGAAAVGEFFATEPLGGHIERIALPPGPAANPASPATPTSTTAASTTPTAS